METSLILSLGLIAGSLIGLSWMAGTDAPYIPTAQEKITEILKTAGVKKGKTFYELGSGDGRLVLHSAMLGAESYGIEQSWLRIWYSRYLARKKGLKNAHFYHGNLFDRQYFPADIIFIYLLPKAVARLEQSLPKELKKGSVIITQSFHFSKWLPYKKMSLKTKNDKIGGEFWFYRT
jgi:SAM-dependent methyltransferase